MANHLGRWYQLVQTASRQPINRPTACIAVSASAVPMWPSSVPSQWPQRRSLPGRGGGGSGTGSVPSGMTGGASSASRSK